MQNAGGGQTLWCSRAGWKSTEYSINIPTIYILYFKFFGGSCAFMWTGERTVNSARNKVRVGNNMREHVHRLDSIPALAHPETSEQLTMKVGA